MSRKPLSAARRKAALALLAPYRDRAGAAPAAAPALETLVARLTARVAENAAARQPGLASLHHFACTGGTLIARALSTLPNTRLLSEVDPFSSLGLRPDRFAPSDLILLYRAGLRPAETETIEAVFLDALGTLEHRLRRQGGRLVVRDHTHSHFCTDVDPAARPLLRAVLARRFALRSAVTVRHPLDSYLSLVKRDWMHFRPATLEEYARRYGLFLDAHAELPIHRYEDFVADPDAVLARLAADLGQSFAPGWQDLLPAVRLSGDSGRSGGAIRPRPRREIPPGLTDEERAAPAYAALCERLGYSPDFDALPRPEDAG